MDSRPITARQANAERIKPLSYNLSVTPGFATTEATERFASRFAVARDCGFYRPVEGLEVSSVGMGTYLGNPDEAADRSYHQAVVAAVRGGINLLDTAINYRNQHSERSIGSALHELFHSGEIRREELVVATKAGFLTPGAVPDFLKPEDVVGNMHSMHPDFLADQIDRSRANLFLDTLDIFYLHNPETQLGFIDRPDFERRIGLAFAKLEHLVSAGKIHSYGTATWDGYRRPSGSGDGLDLARLFEIASQAGGPRHHFRYIQLPFNFAMPEACTNGVLERAAQLGITVVASASLLQARFARGLPESLAVKFPGLSTDAQRAIQFTRSTPGVSVALVGMSQAAHVSENLRVAAVPPLASQDYRDLYQRA
jgi:aryl-alcohol dehydrogenase-like predicted oxidoreductase